MPDTRRFRLRSARHWQWNGLFCRRLDYPVAGGYLCVASAPKSNAAYVAVDEAQGGQVKGNFTVPSHLRDPAMAGRRAGAWRRYKYAHDYPNHYVKQPSTCRMDWRAAHFTARQKMGMRRR